MGTYLSGGRVVARKNHRCYYCGEWIFAGQLHESRSGIEDDIWRMHAHIECDEAAEDWGDDDYECFEPHTMQRPDLSERASWDGGKGFGAKLSAGQKPRSAKLSLLLIALAALALPSTPQGLNPSQVYGEYELPPL